MTRPETLSLRCISCLAILLVGFYSTSAIALQSDRQKPLEIDADTSDGTLGDGRAELRGNVEIRQGSLIIRADVAQVEKVEGRVREVILTGTPALLEQEIEQQGQVRASAERIEYQVATGLVTLTGAADVQHPQYQVSGDVLNYDLNVQNFQGSGEGDNGRLRIVLDPEVIENDSQAREPPVIEPGNEPPMIDSESESDSESDTGAESDNS